MGKIELGNKYTMLELQYALGQKNSGIPVAEVLTRTNSILEDAPWFEANDGTNNKVIQRNSLGGDAQKRQFNAGVTVTAAGKQMYTDGSVMVEDYSEVDVALADVAGGASYRNTEAAAKLENMSQNFAHLLFYDKASATQPMSLNGLATRMSVIDDDMCLSASGSTNLSSIYIVQWGKGAAHLFYPQRSPNKGVSHRDLGEHTKVESDGSQYQVYRDHFKVYGGLSVQDGRCIKRVCNIDVTDLDGFVGFEDLLIKLLNKLPKKMANTVIYCNSDVMTMMDIRAKDKSNVQYGPENVWGEQQLYFKRVPVKQCDAIVNSETKVVA